MDEGMIEKLRELIDRSEIWRVVQTYGRALDRLDVELARSCYHDDAVDDHHSFVGPRDAFIAWANEGTRSFVNSHHTVLNHTCELDGDDAYTETYYYFWGARQEPPHLGSAGRYIDHFQKRNGQWRIANRVATVEKTFELTDNTIWPAIPLDQRGDDTQPIRRDRGDVSYHRPIRVRSARHPGA